MPPIVNILSAAAVLHSIDSLGLWGIFVKSVILSKDRVAAKKTASYIEMPYRAGSQQMFMQRNLFHFKSRCLMDNGFIVPNAGGR
jgi:hypothetical protein